MRILTPFAENSPEVQYLLNQLANRETAHSDYRIAFYKLGEILSSIINEKVDLGKSQVTIACSSEDADWLSKGILDHLNADHTSLAVFWNLRAAPFDQKDITIAPIIKSYIEEVEKTDYLIIVKSIIHSSCVVRTNLNHLIERINPGNIIIVSPVMFADAANSLKKEFPQAISEKFDFIYFATDNEVNTSGEVIPGIGGSVYERLGIGNSSTKNKYIPDIVKERRLRKVHF